MTDRLCWFACAGGNYELALAEMMSGKFAQGRSFWVSESVRACFSSVRYGNACLTQRFPGAFGWKVYGLDADRLAFCCCT